MEKTVTPSLWYFSSDTVFSNAVDLTGADSSKDGWDFATRYEAENADVYPGEGSELINGEYYMPITFSISEINNGGPFTYDENVYTFTYYVKIVKKIRAQRTNSNGTEFGPFQVMWHLVDDSLWGDDNERFNTLPAELSATFSNEYDKTIEPVKDYYEVDRLAYNALMPFNSKRLNLKKSYYPDELYIGTPPQEFTFEIYQDGNLYKTITKEYKRVSYYYVIENLPQYEYATQHDDTFIFHIFKDGELYSTHTATALPNGNLNVEPEVKLEKIDGITTTEELRQIYSVVVYDHENLNYRISEERAAIALSLSDRPDRMGISLDFSNITYIPTIDHEYVYTFKEKYPDTYFTVVKQYSEDDELFVNITNKYKDEVNISINKGTVSVENPAQTANYEITKQWDDFSNSYNKRPDAIKLDVYQNNKYFDTYEFTTNKNVNTEKFNIELPKQKNVDFNNAEIKFTITNKISNETNPIITEHTMTINYDGIVEGKRQYKIAQITPSILPIYRDENDQATPVYENKEIKINSLLIDGEEKPTSYVSLSFKNNWFSGTELLEDIDINCKINYTMPCEYTIKEHSVEDYESVINGLEVTNTLTKEPEFTPLISRARLMKNWRINKGSSTLKTISDTEIYQFLEENKAIHSSWNNASSKQFMFKMSLVSGDSSAVSFPNGDTAILTVNDFIDNNGVSLMGRYASSGMPFVEIVFSKPGEYKFEFKEQPSDIQGIRFDETTFVYYFTISYDIDSGNLYISNRKMYQGNNLLENNTYTYSQYQQVFSASREFLQLQPAFFTNNIDLPSITTTKVSLAGSTSDTSNPASASLGEITNSNFYDTVNLSGLIKDKKYVVRSSYGIVKDIEIPEESTNFEVSNVTSDLTLKSSNGRDILNIVPQLNRALMFQLFNKNIRFYYKDELLFEGSVPPQITFDKDVRDYAFSTDPNDYRIEIVTPSYNVTEIDPVYTTTTSFTSPGATHSLRVLFPKPSLKNIEYNKKYSIKTELIDQDNQTVIYDSHNNDGSDYQETFMMVPKEYTLNINKYGQRNLAYPNFDINNLSHYYPLEGVNFHLINMITGEDVLYEQTPGTNKTVISGIFEDVPYVLYEESLDNYKPGIVITNPTFPAPEEKIIVFKSSSTDSIVFSSYSNYSRYMNYIETGSQVSPSYNFYGRSLNGGNEVTLNVSNIEKENSNAITIETNIISPVKSQDGFATMPQSVPYHNHPGQVIDHIKVSGTEVGKTYLVTSELYFVSNDKRQIVTSSSFRFEGINTAEEIERYYDTFDRSILKSKEFDLGFTIPGYKDLSGEYFILTHIYDYPSQRRLTSHNTDNTDPAERINLQIVNIRIEKTSSLDSSVPCPGVKYTLSGNKQDGSEFSSTLKTNENGILTFDHIETGSYVLREIDATPDWQLDSTEIKVDVDDHGNVRINDVLQNPELVNKTQWTSEKINAVVIKLNNNPRTHADFTFYKLDQKSFNRILDPVSPDFTSPVFVSAATFKLSGISDYGNEIEMISTSTTTGKVSFKNIEQGTYTLEEVDAGPNHLVNKTKWIVKVNEDASITFMEPDSEELRDRLFVIGRNINYELYNENRYWDFSILKVDLSNPSIRLEGAEFTLTGTSDLGTEYNIVKKTNFIGVANFEKIEKGSYTLKETKAPLNVNELGKLGGEFNYIVDPTEYTVSITEDGSISISDIEQDQTGKFVFKNIRKLDDEIVVVKKWNDNIQDENRPTPVVHLQTTEPVYSHSSGIQASLVWNNYPDSVEPIVFDELRLTDSGAVFDKKEVESSWYRPTPKVYLGVKNSSGEVETLEISADSKWDKSSSFEWTYTFNTIEEPGKEYIVWTDFEDTKMSVIEEDHGMNARSAIVKENYDLINTLADKMYENSTEGYDLDYKISNRKATIRNDHIKVFKPSDTVQDGRAKLVIGGEEKEITIIPSGSYLVDMKTRMNIAVPGEIKPGNYYRKDISSIGLLDYDPEPFKCYDQGPWSDYIFCDPFGRYEKKASTLVHSTILHDDDHSQKQIDKEWLSNYLRFIVQTISPSVVIETGHDFIIGDQIDNYTYEGRLSEYGYDANGNQIFTTESERQDLLIKSIFQRVNEGRFNIADAGFTEVPQLIEFDTELQQILEHDLGNLGYTDFTYKVPDDLNIFDLYACPNLIKRLTENIKYTTNDFFRVESDHVLSSSHSLLKTLKSHGYTSFKEFMSNENADINEFITIFNEANFTRDDFVYLRTMSIHAVSSFLAKTEGYESRDELISMCSTIDWFGGSYPEFLPPLSFTETDKIFGNTIKLAPGEQITLNLGAGYTHEPFGAVAYVKKNHQDDLEQSFTSFFFEPGVYEHLGVDGSTTTYAPGVIIDGVIDPIEVQRTNQESSIPNEVNATTITGEKVTEYISEKDYNSDNHWQKLNNNTWVYRFKVFDDTLTYKVWEEPITGYTSNIDPTSPVEYSKFTSDNVEIVNTSSDLANLKISKQAPDYSSEDYFDFEITINDWPGEYTKSGVTFQDGYAEIRLKHGEEIVIEDLPAGKTYKVVEKTIPDNIVTSTNTEGTLEKGVTSIVSFENTKKHGVKLQKKVLDGQSKEGSTMSVSTESGELIEQWTSTGQPHTLSLPAGTYHFTEDISPDGLLRVTNTMVFSVSSDGTVTIITGVANSKEGRLTANNNEITLEDAIDKVNVSITKRWNDEQDNDGKRPSPEEWIRSLHLYGNGYEIDLSNPDLIVDVKDNDDDTYTVNVKGLNAHDSEKIVEFTVSEDDIEGYTSVVDSFIVENTYEPEKINITVEKEWVNDTESDRPASITVNLIADGVVKETVSIDSSSNWKHTFNNLYKYKEGKEISYTIEEVAVEGYNTSIDGFKITNTKEEPPAPKPQDVFVRKVDESGELLEGATLQIILDNEVIEEWISTNEPHKVEGLLPGVNYILRETNAPDNYIVSEDISFVISPEEEQTAITMVNVLSPDAPTKPDTEDLYSVLILKDDSVTQQPLEGAVLQIIDSDNKVVEEWTSGLSPKEFNLQPDTYKIREITAPKGYKLSEDIEFTISEEGEIICESTLGEIIVVHNTPIEDKPTDPVDKPDKPDNPPTPPKDPDKPTQPDPKEDKPTNPNPQTPQQTTTVESTPKQERKTVNTGFGDNIVYFSMGLTMCLTAVVMALKKKEHRRN